MLLNKTPGAKRWTVKLAAISPHLIGRMLPALFSCMPFAKTERFPGDPWPHFQHDPEWYWMHSTGCPNGLYRSRRYTPHWRDIERPAPVQLTLI